MKQITSSAILLRRLNYGEADRILTVITPGDGKISLLAKGVRKSKSKLAGGIELLSVSDITFIEGRGELKTVISTRLQRHFQNIIKDVEKTMLAYELLKAVDKVTHTGAEEGVFELLSHALEGLDDNKTNKVLVAVWFTVCLLRIQGSGINLEKPLNAKVFSDDAKYDFSYDDRSFYVSDGGLFDPKVIKFLRLVERADNPLRLRTIQQADELAGAMEPTAINLLKLSLA